MNRLEKHRDIVIPYRMKSASILNLALRHVLQWPQARKMSIYFDDELFIEGHSTGFTNAAIESGIMNCGALLELIGLGINKDGELRERKGGRQDDVKIEDYGLQPISIAEALKKYPGGVEEAKNALANLLFVRNKWLAHSTAAVELDAPQLTSLEIASRGVPALVVSFFYTKLGLNAPEYKLASRKRNETA